jgi:protein-S-isoprenylcysteine O-methyltransferase Ste14
VFLGLIPFLVTVAGPWLDRRLGLPAAGRRPAGVVAGSVLAVAGYALGLWAVEAQVSRGRGTPLPIMPTQELLTTGPFRHTRNPMTLGTIMAYLGLAVAAGTTAGGAMVLALAGGLVAYLRGLEETELDARFGERYRAYRDATPFLLPWPRAGSAAAQPEGRSSGSTP